MSNKKYKVINNAEKDEKHKYKDNKKHNPQKNTQKYKQTDKQTDKDYWDKKKVMWLKRKIVYPTRPHLKLEQLDEIPYVDENNKTILHKKFEREEQYMTNDFVLPDMTVLELGGRYGTVSCVINNKLENPRNHVVFEPDKTVIPALIKNRKTHKSKYLIVNGIISSKPMKLVSEGYGTSTITASKNDKDIVHSMSLKEIMKKTKLNFDCLVADCEGCLCDLFDDNEKYIKDYKMIIFEADNDKVCDYNIIREKLKSWGFHLLEEGFISVWGK